MSRRAPGHFDECSPLFSSSLLIPLNSRWPRSAIRSPRAFDVYHQFCFHFGDGNEEVGASALGVVSVTARKRAAPSRTHVGARAFNSYVAGANGAFSTGFDVGV
ncbi:hypothetical protein EW146_g8784 [Bondarzewia mesenterica]|uniref:Uncharacterized protein n=1 Tax=Bondarzewia mesenterica TaxID=1095465 RepID=A0A4S4LBL4_9AGAM|nr:hypothetical protein EW146_g8784 [Bondarzewia mesenterica]